MGISGGVAPSTLIHIPELLSENSIFKNTYNYVSTIQGIEE